MAVLFVILVIVFIGIIVYNWYIKVGQFTEKERELLQEGASCNNCFFRMDSKDFPGELFRAYGCATYKIKNGSGARKARDKGICEDYEKES